jgi:hypothetical protein
MAWTDQMSRDANLYLYSPVCPWNTELLVIFPVTYMVFLITYG